MVLLQYQKGTWRIESVISNQIRKSSTANADNNTIAFVEAHLITDSIYNYSEGSFFWGQLNNHPTISVSGTIVVPEGMTGTAQVRLVTIPGGSANPTVHTIVNNAHIEIIKLNSIGPENKQADSVTNQRTSTGVKFWFGTSSTIRCHYNKRYCYRLP